jgi:hypothetical protein
VVTVQDAGGNTISTSTASVTLSIGTNPGGGTLSGNKTVSAVNGVASFSGLSIDKAGTGYRLAAASSGLTNGTSATFNITAGPAVKVGFTRNPSGARGGTAFTTQPLVAVQDLSGNTVTTSNAQITVAIGTNPSGGILSGTKTIIAVSGVATYSGLSIDKVGTGYTLVATSAGLSSGTSAAFNVTVGVAAKLAFVRNPGNAVAGQAFGIQPQVAIQDAGGNTVTSSTVSITVALGNNPTGATLNGTKSVNAVSGVATFTNLSITNSGTGYTLVATRTGLTSATSAAFNVQ